MSRVKNDGSLISVLRFVLTAAHCLDASSVRDVEVVLGKYNAQPSHLVTSNPTQSQEPLIGMAEGGSTEINTSTRTIKKIHFVALLFLIWLSLN